MVTKVKEQIHMADSIVKNDDLEKLLEERQGWKESAASYRKADKAAKDRINSLNLPTPYRVGRFIIAKQDVAAKSVSFETEKGSKFTIKTIGEA